MTKARKPSVSADWQPPRGLNKTELLKYWMERSSRHPDPLERENALTIAIEMLDRWRRGPKAKREKKEKRYIRIFAAEALLQHYRKTRNQTFAELWKKMFNDTHYPSDATRVRARAWFRSRLS